MFKKGLKITLLGSLLGLLSCSGCSKLAVLMTPAKKPTLSHSQLSVQAEQMFWNTLHQGQYSNIPTTLRLLTAAYLENPNDPNLAAYLGFTHLWEIAERQRQGALSPRMVEHAILAKKYFADAVELAPQDARFLGFYGDATLIQGKIFNDKRQQTEGYFILKKAIKAWPQFNYFTAGYPLSVLPADSKLYYYEINGVFPYKRRISPMKKTKTQAQKRHERETRMQEKALARRERKEALTLEFQRKPPEQQASVEAKPLSKKELRKQKKEIKQQTSLELPSTDSFAPHTEAVYPVETSHVKNNKVSEKLLASALEQELTISESLDQARLVQNHSTYCEGLKPLLIKLQKFLPECTIIPGVITRSDKHCETFELRFQRAVDDNTYKLVARYGYTTQDVLISVTNPQLLTTDLLRESIERVLTNKPPSDCAQEIPMDTSLSQYNRAISHARQNFWREQQQEKHQYTKERENLAKKEEKVNRQRRKLAAKGVDSSKIDEYAERDVDILSGKNRGKYSMK